MASMLVIPDLVRGTTTAEWREATRAIASGVGIIDIVDVVAMPGRNGQPQPIGGEYDLVTPGYAVAHILASHAERRWDIVVGAGISGWAAHLTVFGGHADSLVLIDGLGDPWITTTERSKLRRTRMRSIEADPEALAHHRGGDDDPRLAYGACGLGSRPMAIRAAVATRVPTLLISTGGRLADREVIAGYRSARVLSSPTADATTLLASIAEWWDELPSPRT